MSTLEKDDSMKIRCVWEHNGNDSLIYAENLAGAFTRGETREIALGKMEDEVKSFFGGKARLCRRIWRLLLLRNGRQV